MGISMAAELDFAIREVCPIIGVSIGRKNDKRTWRIIFDVNATEDQKESAQLVLTNFVHQA